MSETLRVAALAAGLQDAPVPAAISLVKDNGVLKFCDDDGHSLRQDDACMLIRNHYPSISKLDRDTTHSDAFRSVLVREGIQVIRLPPRSPNLNEYVTKSVGVFRVGI
jgi:hypothetical protein